MIRTRITIPARYLLLGKRPAVIMEKTSHGLVPVSFPYTPVRQESKIRASTRIDIAACARKDAPGIVAIYYYTPPEFIRNYTLTIQNLLSGYSTVIVQERFEKNGYKTECVEKMAVCHKE